MKCHYIQYRMSLSSQNYFNYLRCSWARIFMSVHCVSGKSFCHRNTVPHPHAEWGLVLRFHIHNWFPDTSEDRYGLVRNSATDTPATGLVCESPDVSSQQGTLEVVPSLYVESQLQGYGGGWVCLKLRIWLSYCLWGTKENFKQWTLHPSLLWCLHRGRAMLLE